MTILNIFLCWRDRLLWVMSFFTGWWFYLPFLFIYSFIKFTVEVRRKPTTSFNFFFVDRNKKWKWFLYYCSLAAQLLPGHLMIRTIVFRNVWEWTSYKKFNWFWQLHLFFFRIIRKCWNEIFFRTVQNYYT